MRPLIHPAIGDVTVEAVLHALADPVRVSIFREIVGQDCSASCSAFQEILTEPIPKSTLSHHIRILREAGLIRNERRGVEVLNSSRCAEVDARFPGLLGSIVSAYERQIKDRTARSKGQRNASPQRFLKRASSDSLRSNTDRKGPSTSLRSGSRGSR